MLRKQVIIFLFAMVMVFGFQMTTYAWVQFDEGEYIRITQPTNKEYKPNITFDSQVNLMGEARVGTVINIKVYDKYIIEDEEDFFVKDLAKKYLDALIDEFDLKPVGSTNTFNQLIDLEDGENTIVITYSVGEDKEEVIYLFITKKEKGILENYVNINNPFK